MRCVCIGGWAISADEILSVLRGRWPEAEHVVVTPGPDWELKTAQLEPIDRLVGYSLGAFLLLRAPAIRRPTIAATFAAPLLDLRREQHAGGQVEEIRLRYMMRRLARDPLAAIGEFYRSAGLSVQAPSELPYPLEDLTWGLEQLLQPRGEARVDRYAEATAVVGDRDPLIDSSRLAELWPAARVVVGAGHDLAPLLEAAP